MAWSHYTSTHYIWCSFFLSSKRNWHIAIIMHGENGTLPWTNEPHKLCNSGERQTEHFTLLLLIYVHMDWESGAKKKKVLRRKKNEIKRKARTACTHSAIHFRWRLLIFYCQQLTINEDNKIFFNYVKWMGMFCRDFFSVLHRSRSLCASRFSSLCRN